MKKNAWLFFLGFGLFAMLSAFAGRAHAALGAYSDSIESDRKTLSATRGGATERNGYTVHEMTSDATTVREYVSPGGIVFGIAWNGLMRPDLTQLLGSYAGLYQDALQQAPRQPGLRHRKVKADGVVVEQWGHMRSLQGRAYATELIPPGVSVDEIR